MSRKLEDLEPDMKVRAQAAIEDMRSDARLKELGVTGIFISETRRSLAVQMAYYSRGRMSAYDVKKMYAAAGLYSISEDEAKIKNTNTLSSKHIQGLAIDLVPVMNEKVNWNAPESVWKRMGEIGTRAGLFWGGNWKDFPDRPHFEMGVKA